jgi:hypothetical protein
MVTVQGFGNEMVIATVVVASPRITTGAVH